MKEIPYSCCKRKEARPCNHRDLLFNYQHTKNNLNFSFLGIYTEGCHYVFVSAYWHKALYFVILPILLKACLLFIMIILLKYIITSIEMLLKNPNTKMTSKAYLLSAYEDDDDIVVSEERDTSEEKIKS